MPQRGIVFLSTSSNANANMLPELPNELQSYIATFLDNETDLGTLQNLALISSVFLPFAHGRIFDHVFLYDHNAPLTRTLNPASSASSHHPLEWLNTSKFSASQRSAVHAGSPGT